MPIINFDNDTVQLEFGYGDIEVAHGLLDTEDTLGAVCFFPQETPMEIGAHRDYTDPPRTVNREDTPVRMVFTKTESIDVVLWALMRAKEQMIQKNSEKDKEGTDGND